ncbi:MAG: IS5 family transposase [Ignavibacteriaceae bacterium]|nr:IS5 family transposase [Ignavibacteriaceae bacterium]
MNEPGFFDINNRLEKLDKHNNPLPRINAMIEWESFRRIIEKSIKREAKGPGGRPRYDAILMFKILILQRLYNISDQQMEYQITDRLSFSRFLGLKMEDTVPDQNTIWLFRENLTRNKVIERIFKKFDRVLEEKQMFVKEGSIIDAAIVEVPRQRNTPEENHTIKEGQVPEEWKENPDKLRQKDTCARWVKKGGENYYGYKNHIKAGQKSKLIRKYRVSDASVHDSQMAKELIDANDNNKLLYGDSAYSTDEIRDIMSKRGITDKINVKGCRYKKLTKLDREKNRKRSKIRCRIEHIFGFMTQSMKGIYIRSIGKVRAAGIIGLMNLTYNFQRYIQLVRA